MIDSHLALVERGVGNLDTRLPSGVYKVKVRRGREEAQQIILLDHDQEVPLRPPAVASPAPFEGTTRTHEWQIAAAQRESARVHVQAGKGAQVFLMSRYWTSPARHQRDQPDHPGRGLSLRTMSGRIVVDYERDGVLAAQGTDPLAACTVSLAPGTYLLHRRSGGRQALEQAIVASPGWQTQVFVLKDPALGEAEPEGGDPDLALQRALRPDAISVLMCRGPFDSRRADMELAEVARLALADERRILSADLSQMLAGKFDNPMLGIFGGHLLLLSLARAVTETQARMPQQVRLEVPVDAAYLDVIVRNLRDLVGPDHPDVEALSTRCVDRRLRARQPLVAPPMLRRSWSLYVAASNERRDLIPRGIWTRVRQFVAAPPFFTWVRTRSAEADPAVAMARSVARRQARARAERARASEAARRGRAAGPRGVARGRGGPSMSLAAPPELDVQAHAAAGPSHSSLAPPAPRRKPDLRQLSLDQDIPRGVIDEAFARR